MEKLLSVARENGWSIAQRPVSPGYLFVATKGEETVSLRFASSGRLMEAKRFGGYGTLSAASLRSFFAH
jgi:hypothetical protein